MIYDFFYYLKAKIKENCYYYYRDLKSKYYFLYFTYIYDSDCNLLIKN